MTTKPIVRLNKNGGANITYKTEKGEVKVDFSYNHKTHEIGNDMFPDLQKKDTNLVITISENGKEAEKNAHLVAYEYNHKEFASKGKANLMDNLADIYYGSMVFDAGDEHAHEQSPSQKLIVKAALDVRNHIENNQKVLAAQKTAVKG